MLVLNGGLDHEVIAREQLKPCACSDSFESLGARCRSKLLLFDEPVKTGRDSLQGLSHPFRSNVLETDLVACDRADLGYTSSHLAGTDNANPGNCFIFVVIAHFASLSVCEANSEVFAKFDAVRRADAQPPKITWRKRLSENAK